MANKGKKNTAAKKQYIEDNIVPKDKWNKDLNSKLKVLDSMKDVLGIRLLNEVFSANGSAVNETDRESKLKPSYIQDVSLAIWLCTHPVSIFICEGVYAELINRFYSYSYNPETAKIVHEIVFDIQTKDHYNEDNDGVEYSNIKNSIHTTMADWIEDITEDGQISSHGESILTLIKSRDTKPDIARVLFQFSVYFD